MIFIVNSIIRLIIGIEVAPNVNALRLFDWLSSLLGGFSEEAQATLIYRKS